MDSFKHVFKEEAQELIGNLEQALLVLEKNPKDEQSIDQIFRVMHTLKGNSDMFGFDKIEEITHQLESVYDGIRNSEDELNDEILSVTFSTVDHIRDLLNEGNSLQDTTLKTHNLLTNELSALTNGTTQLEDHILNGTRANGKQVKSAATYCISLTPNVDFLKDGSNPLYLLEDLDKLGHTVVISNRNDIPTLSNLDPTDCHTSWIVILVADCDMQEILDVFMFVEQHTLFNLQKIADVDLLSNEHFVNYLKGLPKEKLNSTILVDYAAKLEQEQSANQSIINGDSISEDKISSIRVSSDKLDQLMNLVSELVTTQARLSMITEEVDSTQLESLNEDIEKLTRQLRDNTFSICLIPINSIETRFQRLIRDLSKELDKKVNFIIEGGATELDKTIIESLSEPLLHILRNSMDHGIETSTERLKAGKEKNGTILLKAYYSGSNVFIEVKDDGKGIDHEAVKAKAIEKGMIGESHDLSEKELSDLLFQAGFSTSKSVTSVSGRGVGMDAVKRKIEGIQGEVSIRSKKGAGTTVTIKLPLTLSIMDGLLVSVNQTQFVMPISIVEKLYAIEKEKVTDIFNHLVVLDGEQVQFLNLREELEMGGTSPDINQIVLVKYGDKKFGLVFDRLEGEYQAVLKPLGKLFKYQEFVSGATILGDGSVALVLDTNKIITHLIN
jgi:two-component system chemotaxis sensor kinase CheA